MTTPGHRADTGGVGPGVDSAELGKVLSASSLRRLPRFLVLGAPAANTSAVLEAAGLERLQSEDVFEWACWRGERVVAVEPRQRQSPSGKKAAATRRMWKTHVAALQRSRPSAPLDGIIAMVPLTLTETDIRAQTTALRSSVDEFEALLGRQLPLAVVFTDTDRIAGFTEFFQSPDATRRDALLGAWEFKPRSYAPSYGEAAFDRICAGLGSIIPARLDEATDLRTRALAFAFPSVFASMKERVLAALGSLSAPSPYLGFGFASVSARNSLLRDLFAITLPAIAAMPTRPSPRRARLLGVAALAAAAIASVALIGGWSTIFVRERALIAESRQVIADLSAPAASALQTSSVSSPDFENVLEPLAVLHDLPVRSGLSSESPAWTHWLGLSQRANLAGAADVAYGYALQRLLRPRLMLALREDVTAGLREPDELYQPLKAYLMLGGGAPVTDDSLIRGWAEQDWERRYPGSANRNGRDQLKAHLEAMLRLETDHPPSHLLDRKLVETAQRALARMDMPDRALALIRSSTYSASLPNFFLAGAAGPQTATLFETSDGRSLATLSVPGLYTAAGFHFFLNELASLAQRLKADQWVMGAGGETANTEERLRRLGPELLDRYTREFMAAWTDMLDTLRLRPLSAGEPDYPALAAASAADSPLRSLVEAIAAETEVSASSEAADLGDEAAAGLAMIGLAVPSSKSQSRAGSAFSADFASPGATIEARFRPFRTLVAGPSGQRPIDILLRNLSEIRQSLRAGNQAHGGRLQLQVLKLRTNASRLPAPFAGMFQEAAETFESAVVEASVSELDRLLETTIGPACRSALTDAFPFGKDGGRDLPLSDFARLFGPNGEFDRFFAQNLASLVDVTGPDWRWRPNTRLGRDLPPEVPRSFQRAMEIRDAFFRPGSSTPGVSLTFKPGALSKNAEMALLDVSGNLVHVYPDGNVPSSLVWPQFGMDGSSSLSLTPPIEGRNSALRFEGPWSLLRLIATATRSVSPEGVELRFVIGGRNVAFTVTSDVALNLLSLPLLEEFKCPTGL